ncbi:9046_t:CDS:2, partial [Acaulospora colombiana]
MPPKRKSTNSTKRSSTAVNNDSPLILSDSSSEDIVSSQSPIKSKSARSAKTNGVASMANAKGKLTRSSTRTSIKSDQGQKTQVFETPPRRTAIANPSGKIPYVDVPRRTSSLTNVSQSSGTHSRRQSALDSLARSRSRRTTISTPATPASSEPPHTSDGEILTDDELQYKDPLESLSDDVESDESVSEFEADSVSEGSGLDIGKMGLDDDSDEASEISEVEFVKKNKTVKKAPVTAKKAPEFKIGGSSFDLGKKASAFKTNGKTITPLKRGAKPIKPTAPPLKRGTKATNGMDVDEDGEGHGVDTDDEMVQAAIRASYATAAQEILREFSSGGAGPSGSSNNNDRMSMSVSPAKKPNGVTKGKKKAFVVDSDEDSDEVPLVQKKKVAKGKGKKQTIETIDLEDDDSDDDFRMAPRAEDSSANGSADKQAKVIQKKEEAQERKRLGRKLTY